MQPQKNPLRHQQKPAKNFIHIPAVPVNQTWRINFSDIFKNLDPR